MFTGIVEAVGEIKSVSQGGSSLVLCVACPFAAELALGESVAVDGVCLTVTGTEAGAFTADVTPESFRRTALGALHAGSAVNLERAMRADGRFGGHIVSGHIDGTGRLAATAREENAVNVTVSVPAALARYIIEKGSVAVDGISLTVARVERHGGAAQFTVAVIPHTWASTALCKKPGGAPVNIECDIVGKYIEQFITDGAGAATEAGGISPEILTDFPRFH